MTIPNNPTLQRLQRLRELDAQLLSMMVGREPQDETELRAWSERVEELRRQIKLLESK